MYAGYVFTADGKDALEMMGTAGVRYVAEMTDGTGFVAFDSEDPIGGGSAIAAGWTVWVMEPHPDYPPSWPQSPKGPKRQTPTGDERFILYAAYNRKDIGPVRAGVWVTDGQRIMLLVEVGPEYDSTLDPIWSSEVLHFLDARVSA